VTRRWSENTFWRGVDAYLNKESLEAVWLDGAAARAGWTYAKRRDLSGTTLGPSIPDFERVLETLYDKIYKRREYHGMYVTFITFFLLIYLKVSYPLSFGPWGTEIIISFPVIVVILYVFLKNFIESYFAPQVWLHLLEKEKRLNESRQK
jgi:hypothetical protein